MSSLNTKAERFLRRRADRQFQQRQRSRIPMSVACLIGRDDECTNRGYRHGIPAHLSAKDYSPCQCPCGHTPTKDMILQAYAAGVLE